MLLSINKHDFQKLPLWLCWLLIVYMLTGCGGSGGGDDAGVMDMGACNSATGLRAPLPACSPDTPCTRVATNLGVQTIETSEVIPVCAGLYWDARLTQSVIGYTRHACIVRPSGASNTSKRPLVVWFHGGGDGSADDAATTTQLVAKAGNFDLTGDVARPGFTLLAVQGRNLRFPTAAPRDGHHHDFYYRDLDSPSTNPDIANVDAFIDAVVQEGIVDTNRIYVMGWSNGAFFSQMYAIARNTTTTPGGNNVASAAVFSAASPFDDISWNVLDNEALDSNDSSCALQNIPSSTVPIQMVYRTSDSAVACDTAQATCFQTEPGYVTEQWINDASNAGIPIQGLRIGGLESGASATQDADAPNCTDFTGSCPVVDCSNSPLNDGCLSLINHLRWPDGDYTNANAFVMDREPDMLLFLKNNPLM